MTYAAYFTAAVQIIFLFNLFWSMRRGAKAPTNPWESTTLEWSVPSPPPFDNFAGQHPVVYHGPYEYSVPGRAQGLHHAKRSRRSPFPGVAHPNRIMAYGWVTHKGCHSRAGGLPPLPAIRGGGGAGRKGRVPPCFADRTHGADRRQRHGVCRVYQRVYRSPRPVE